MTDSGAPHASAELIIQAFRASPDAITISRLRDGLLLEVNRGFERITGFSRAEAVGKTTNELDVWTDRDRSQMVERILRDRRVENMAFTFRRKTGELRECRLSAEIVDLDGEPCMVAVTRDVTRERAIEARLRASEEKFAKAFRSSPDAITISRLRDGLFLDVNEGFQKLSGFSYEEAVGKTAPSLGLWRGKDREKVVEVMRREGRLTNHEISYKLKDGEVRDFLLSAEIIELDGEPCMLAVSRDISELKAASRERERLIGRLEAQNEELERFAYTISHDLKSPLVTILGFLQLVERACEDRNHEAVLSGLARIRDAGKTMDRHLEELLELSRIGRAMNPPESVGLTEIAREATARLTGLLEEREAEVVVPDGLPVVHADRLRLLEVLQNLIENAAKFAGDGPAPRIEVGGREEDGEIRCFVKDNGIGIENQYLDKVFGLFERLDSQVPGTGIGLALVKRIVEVHGGRIWIESEGVGRGATVFFTLPAEPPAEAD